MRGSLQNLEYRSRDSALAFDWLIGVGVGAKRNDFRLISRVRQLKFEQLCRVRLCVKLCLEIEPCGVSEIAMCWPRVTIDAAMLAAAIGVDRAIERDIGTVVARYYCSRRFLLQFRLKCVEVAKALPAVVKNLSALSLKAPRLIGARAAATAQFGSYWCVVSDLGCSAWLFSTRVPHGLIRETRTNKEQRFARSIVSGGVPTGLVD